MANENIKTTTKKEYKCTFGGYEIIVPKGSVVTSVTACGIDKSYHFLDNYRAMARELTGYEDSILAHDLCHTGLNTPKEFCNNY